LSIICSGESNGNRFALEDFAVAARYIHKMAREYSPLELNDGARLAIELGNYEGWIASSLTSDLTPSSRLITGTTHGQELAKLGFSADLQFCTTENTSSLVPYVVTADENSALLKVSENETPPKSF
jgi:phosphosulfolactate phosphohydrolase-like enzyme